MPVKFSYRILALFIFIGLGDVLKAQYSDTLTICKGNPINYTSSATGKNVLTVSWVFNGGTPGTSNSENQPGVLYNTAGRFTTTLYRTYDDNSTSFDSFLIIVKDHPIPAFTLRDTGFCSANPSPITLNTVNFPDAEYLWSTGETTPSITVSSPNTYTVIIKITSDLGNCDSVNKTLTVRQFTSPTANLGQDILMCQSQVITLTAGPATAGYQYLWQPNGEVTRQINVSLPGTYSVTVTTPDKCTATDFIDLKDSCPHYIFVPDAVSPNDDLLNDFYLKVWNFTPTDYTFNIYNRWGELLFETNDMNAGWDCKVNNELVQQDIYVYKITYRDTDKKWYEMRGTFLVVR